VTRDKDGIGAALMMAELAALLKQKGQTLLDRLREIREKHGLYVSRQKSITLPGKEGAAQIKALMDGLRKKRLELIGSAKVESRWDLWSGERVKADGSKERVSMPSSDVLSYALQGGGRVAVRPSGTEPKVKIYFDVVQSLSGGEDLAAATTRGQTQIDGLEAAMLREMGLA
jgi:phosphomannomutase